MQFMQFKPSSLHREIVAKLIQTTQLKGGKSCAIHCNNTKSDADVFVLFLWDFTEYEWSSKYVM